MILQLSILHSATCVDWRCRRAARKRRALVARLAAFAIAAALAMLIVYGEHWTLTQARAASNELVAATYMIKTVYGDAAGACDGRSGATVPGSVKADAL